MPGQILPYFFSKASSLCILSYGNMYINLNVPKYIIGFSGFIYIYFAAVEIFAILGTTMGQFCCSFALDNTSRYDIYHLRV
jgi:hypothetical protein